MPKIIAGKTDEQVAEKANREIGLGIDIELCDQADPLELL